MTYVGVDVGGNRCHCVAVDGSAHLVDAELFGPADVDQVVQWAASAEAVAIDAPAALSIAPHAAEAGRRSPKFSFARYAEVDLAERFGIWVPWVTPRGLEACQPWMLLGFQLFDAFASAGHPALEVYPYMAFVTLHGPQLPKKTTRAGIVARAAVLGRAGIDDHLGCGHTTRSTPQSAP